MMRVLSLVARLAVLLTRKPRAADELRLLRILQIEDLDDDVAEARLAGGGVEVAGVLRPPTFVRAHDECAAAARPARVRRCAGDLRHERDLGRVGIARRDVEDLVLEVLAGLALGQDFGVANQVVVARAVELVVVDHRDAARVPVRLVRDVPHELRVRGIVDVQDRRAVPLLLAGDRIQLRLAVPEALVVADVHPAAIRGIGQRGDDQRLAPLQIVVADQAHIVRVFRTRIRYSMRLFLLPTTCHIPTLAPRPPRRGRVIVDFVIVDCWLNC